MRQLPSAGLVAAVALALGAMAHAATTTTKATTPQGTISLAQQSGNFTMSSPRIPGPANAASTTTTTDNGNTGTTTTQAPQNTTTVDVRGQQNQQAVANTFASGSTSALGPLAGTATTTSGTAGTGTTSGAGATGTTAGSTTGTATLGGAAAFGSLGTAVGVPIFANPADVTFAGTTPTTIAASTTPTFTNADIYANASLAQNGIVVTEAQANGANVDRAIAQVSRDRKRIGRNGQLLYSIAPRTNVDRTAQMPDDGLPPSLTGSNSTLTR